MYRLPFIVCLLAFCGSLMGQSPHGDGLAMDCAACHNTGGWTISADEWKFDSFEPIKEVDTLANDSIAVRFKFNHQTTDFPLYGQHQQTDCRSCHESLVFEQAETSCVSCHLDVHSMSVGDDCMRCHNSDNWLVDNIPELHEQNGFPLLGPHANLSCVDCHMAETSLKFDRLGNECINCHQSDFDMTENPNHQDAGFSTNCIDCHSPENTDWGTDIVVHSFFPLTLGHDIADCKACHITNNFSDASPECISCHQEDFNNTQNPDHIASGFENDCAACHTTNPGWMPADFRDHDALFPIYSGEHRGEWDDCIDCHTNPNDYSIFSCTNCHTNPDTDDEHDGVSGYVYEDKACFACHPTGSEDGIFNHDNTGFSLTGAHLQADCLDCHADGFAGTSSICADCHTVDFEASLNPNHTEINLPNDCAACHTTDPEWMPATFDIHDDFYVLEGAHAAIANDCAACHNGDYNNTPNTCIGCHQMDYDNTSDPNHQVANFPTDCIACHSQDSWEPATFDHDAQYFPIYSGTHQGEWSECLDCHTDPNNYAIFQCINCHINPETDEEHEGIGGYIYEDNACLACHPTGDADDGFNHDNTAFPLTGAHIGADCLDCHADGYAGTTTDCNGCHQEDFNATSNPNHTAIGISTDCITCHTTDPGWSPASFDIHDDVYALTGAHATIADDCVSCHNGDYNNTPNTCAGCHQEDYNATINPNHGGLNLSNDCMACHTTDPGWMPATFDVHDDFYVLEGAHALIANDCAACHSDDYNNTPNTCVGCHQMDYDNTTDPNHQTANFSTDCTTCHNQDVWSPSTFDHNTIYPLNGAHADISNDCLACHANGYENTPNTCVGCHQMEYDNTSDPNHQSANFSTDCVICHNEIAWEPSTFDHDAQYFPIYSGAHQGEWSECLDCHTDPNNYAIFQCINCHTNPETDEEHEGIGGYIYEDNACLACHPTGDADDGFNHDNTAFPLTGAHIGADCLDCHSDGYAGTTTDCNGCHQEDFNATSNPNHTAIGISTDCITCHTTDPGWSPANFDMHDDVFALTGAHATIADDCVSCHNGDYNNTPNTCAGCHQEDYNSTANPDHGSLNLSNDCMACHTTDPGWMPATFDVHDDFYVLEGAHALITNDCAACHNGDYNNTPNTCVGCHQMEYDNTTNPNHESANFSTDCTICHNQDAWEPSTFDHDAQYFPIYSGAHQGEWSECLDCHTDPNNYAIFQCINCHTNPDTDEEHEGIGGYIYEDNACLACHPTGDADDGFNHDNTAFPLTGAHIGADCLDCHLDGYDNTPTDCNGCHQENFNATSNPNHPAIGISTDCIACHTTDPGWSPASFDMHDDFYALTGAHATIADDCVSCHNGDYNNTPNTCAGCHQEDYNTTVNPDHGSLNLPNDCMACHTTDPGWMPASFEVHDDFYVLEGAHALIANDCAACHNGDYNNTPNTCVGCHQMEYDNTTNPDHQAANFSTDCTICHGQEAWTPSTFDHNNIYPLNGAHAVIANDCLACHADGYDNTPNTCIGCHLSEYNNTTNPDHQTANFPTDCLNCHTETTWTPSTFNHDAQYFPIYSGKHEGEWNTCVECHINPNNYSIFSCIDCHEHNNQNEVDDDHDEVNGYQYESNACFACHPTGEE